MGRVAVCVHPGNDRARRLPAPVCGESDVVDAFTNLVGTSGLEEMEPAAVVAAVESAAPGRSEWASWIRDKCLLG